MARSALLPLLAGLVLAGAAVAVALNQGGGTIDVPVPPDVKPPDPPLPPGAVRRKVPRPRLPAGYPKPAADAVAAAWPAIEEGTPEEASAALATLSPVAAESPFNVCAPATLEALAPALRILITDHPDTAVPAMRCTVFLARAGGPEGRAALGRTDLLTRAFGQSALAGTPELQVETAGLLGFAGGDVAQELLVLLMAPSRKLEVRAAAAAALGEVFALDLRLPAEAITAVIAGAGDGEPVPLRRACLRTMDRAWNAFRPYEPGPVAAAALNQPDRGLQMTAASFFCNHVLPAQGPDVLAAVPGAEEQVLALLADALHEMTPEGWQAPLRKRLPDIKDETVRRSVEKAIGR